MRGGSPISRGSAANAKAEGATAESGRDGSVSEGSAGCAKRKGAGESEGGSPVSGGADQ